MLRSSSTSSDGLDGGTDAEELRDDLAEASQRFRAVDGDPQVRAVVEALGVPGIERAQLVHDPAIVAAGDVERRRPRRRMPEALGFAGALVQQQLDVLEQEPPALGRRDL